MNITQKEDNKSIKHDKLMMKSLIYRAFFVFKKLVEKNLIFFAENRTFALCLLSRGEKTASCKTE